MNQPEGFIENKYLLKSSEYYSILLKKLDNFEIERCFVLENLETFLKWNKQTQYISEEKLQKLWMKQIRKYKFSLDEWEKNYINTNIHAYLVKEKGQGLQKLIRFYKDRHGIKWLENAFDYGMTLLIKLGGMNGSEMFFLTYLICYEWEKNYLEDEEVKRFFCNSVNSKVKEVYNSFMDYNSEQNHLTAIKLYKLLSKYNPQFNINSASTPEFYKKLSLS
ncbi:hypothetical protein P9B03_01540 [Metasolibacillus meyeri]|uniref:Uncharacterized protein n=1 Tax=Metasolibacillus meyeri TaxID=1071052 RepID=A0AAW9NFF4_9BACL|nr:hypothetical protein [Metasolibacillus meyeri]MEC1177154.1 hypothetical protein [Metasolibacillus meyeri]